MESDPLLEKAICEFWLFLLVIFVFAALQFLIPRTFVLGLKCRPILVRKHLWLGSILGAFLTFICVSALIFFVFSGLAEQYSHLLSYLLRGTNKWLHSSVSDAFLSVVSQDAWLRLKIFLALFVSFVFSAPFTCQLALGLSDFEVVYCNRQFLIFPLRYLLKLKGKLWRTWSELASFELEAEDSEISGHLVLRFTDGAVLKVARDTIRNEDFDWLLWSVAEVKHGAINSDLVSCVSLSQEFLTEGGSNFRSVNSSYTQLWEQEYERWQPTTFVPLSHGHTLQDGKYIIHEQLSSSALTASYIGMSAVGERVHIKESVAPSGASDGDKLSELFLRECLHLSKLKHPQIASIIDTFRENSRNYLLTEYIEGSTLEKVRSKRKISLATALGWIVQICEILEYLHGQEPPILHRDITPNNLILTSANKLFLTDFGAAKAFQENVTGTLIGKQCYIAPEVLRGRPTVQSDIYSLGAVLFTLLTGREPEALSVCSPVNVEASLSKEINSFVEHCTELDEGKRFQSSFQVKEEAIRLLGLLPERERGGEFSIKLKSELEQAETLQVIDRGEHL